MDKRKIVWFGMKLSPQEKREIELLAEARGVSQKEVIMGLVREARAASQVVPNAGSVLEAAADLVGQCDGPDLLRDPNRFEGYGQ